MRIRHIVAAAAIAAAAATGGAAAASASSTPVYSTSTTVKYVYAPKCIHTHTHATRYYTYNSKAGRYLRLVKPSVTNSDSYRCHS